MSDEMVVVLAYHTDGRSAGPEIRFFPVGQSQASEVAVFVAKMKTEKVEIYSIESTSLSVDLVFPIVQDQQDVVPF